LLKAEDQFVSTPETRPSLILRLPNHQDVQAWSEFTQIYEPLVYRLAKQMGMQHADAVEAQQEVMLHLAKVVDGWEPTTDGSFRGWLYRVARNVMLRHLERQQRHPRGSADTRPHAVLAETPEKDASGHYDLEFQRQAFTWAAARVRNEVNIATWQAFWLSFVDQKSVDEVATQLDMARGNVYVARSRVMKRLREEIERQVNNDWADFLCDQTEAKS